MKSAAIRQAFLDFFQAKDHKLIPSGSLIPANDPTLLFANSGMVQFKEVFDGSSEPVYPRGTSCQRCVRAGGKHNDLENVGYTARHHVFFEMLGNFSFGDYFKLEAIQLAWEFLTTVLKLPKERLWVTVHHEDQEALNIWVQQIGVAPDRVSKLGADNFWQAGETGPCGPSSEVFYDHGPEVWGGPPGSADEDGDRYVEIWNLVFMQFDRQLDGELKTLPKPSIDTGMGLERVTAIMQGVHSNFEIDTFAYLIESIAEIIHYDEVSLVEAGISDSIKSLRVVADHIRAIAFLMVEGIVPSNEGRGYVLRRIMRRAMRHGYKVGRKQAFLAKCLTPLIEQMGEAYPELAQHKPKLVELIDREEQQFQQTLEQGMKILEGELAQAKADGRNVSGQSAFLLYDTYGFPVDLTADIVREQGLELNMTEYEQAMEAQRSQSRAGKHFAQSQLITKDLSGQTRFTGYELLEDKGLVIQLYCDQAPVDQLGVNETGIMLADQSPFYGESGGQIGDTGVIKTDTGEFEVFDTQKEGKHHLHHGRVRTGIIKAQQAAQFLVDTQRRAEIKRHHSATHLLDAALRVVLGNHVVQKGSLVEAGRLRFDFANPDPLTQQQLAKIEQLVNGQILANQTVQTRHMPIAQAKEQGAIALFGEKYEAEVRVLYMGTLSEAVEQASEPRHFSIELCGGTHVDATGDIGLVKILSESGIAAGVRRIEAVAGQAALELVNQLQRTQSELAGLLKSEPGRLIERVGQLQQDLKAQSQQVATLEQKLFRFKAEELVALAEPAGQNMIVCQVLRDVAGAQLRALVDQCKQNSHRLVIVFVIVDGDRTQFVAGVSSSLIKQIKAGDIVKYIGALLDGKGGGRPDFAQGGGLHPSRVHEAVVKTQAWLVEQLG